VDLPLRRREPPGHRRRQPPNTLTYRFRYDGWGRRVIETAGTPPTGTDTRLLWCGEAICQTRTASDVPIQYHYPQGELRGTQRLYYATDHLGSVREVRDLASGQTVAAFDYTAYGAIRAQSGTLTPDRGYAGLWRHASDLYLTHYRAYSPTYGRWVTRDPIGEAGGVNLYLYANANPLRFTDPLGLNPAVGAIAGGSIGGPPGAVIGGIIGFGIGIAIGDVMFSEDGSDSDDSLDSPDDDPKQCDDGNKKRNCQALKNSILNTCSGLTGKAKFRCFAAANTAYRQCMGYE
jgi:RHS repeat-associated protein